MKTPLFEELPTSIKHMNYHTVLTWTWSFHIIMVVFTSFNLISFHNRVEGVCSQLTDIVLVCNHFVNFFQGKALTSIEPGSDLNDLCIFPDSGMLFLANEAPKVLTYYIPVSIL